MSPIEIAEKFVGYYAENTPKSALELNYQQLCQAFIAQDALLKEAVKVIETPDRLIAQRQLDCGDNSCSYKLQRGGMRTNGGCRCVMNKPRDVDFVLSNTTKRAREFLARFEKEKV